MYSLDNNILNEHGTYKVVFSHDTGGDNVGYIEELVYKGDKDGAIKCFLENYKNERKNNSFGYGSQEYLIYDNHGKLAKELKNELKNWSKTQVNNFLNNFKKEKSMNVFVTSGKVGDDKTIIGFGALQEYEGKKPNARDVFNKINSIDAFLKSVDANKIPLNLKTGNKEVGETYMKADAYYQKGISKDGKAYAFNKIAIEVQPEKRNDVGELIQNAEKLYATKTKEGYVFDKTNDEAIINKFNSLIKEGVDFTLSATKNTTLEKYPNLMQVVNKIDKSANIEIDFVESQGAVIKSIQSPAGNKLESGTEQIINHAKDKGMDR